MAQRLLVVYRLCCAALFGAQVFFAAVAAQVVFSREVAALPRDDARRRAAADAVGAMLGRLDAASLVLCAAAAGCAVVLARRRPPGLSPTAKARSDGGPAQTVRGLPRARWPLAAGLLALCSLALVTPAIHAARAAGETGSARFGLLHAASSGLLLAEMILLAVAAASASAADGLTPPAVRL